jgi:hypothetical protein
MVAYGTSFFGRPVELLFALTTERRTRRLGVILKNAGRPYLSDKTVEGRTVTGRTRLPGGEP